MTEFVETFLLRHDHDYDTTDGPSFDSMKGFYALQQRHVSAGTLHQLKATPMAFTLSDREGHRIRIEILVTRLDDFDPIEGEVVVYGMYEGYQVVIDYDMRGRCGSLESQRCRH